MEDKFKEDEALRGLFAAFEPELGSSSADFMERLEHRMEGMEIVRQSTRSVRRRSRVACVVSAFAGFITGVLLTLLYPFVSNLFARLSMPSWFMESAEGDSLWQTIISGISRLNVAGIEIDSVTVGYVVWLMVIAGMSVAASMATYNGMTNRMSLSLNRN